MKRDGADFDAIPQRLADLDRRLKEWAIWCNGTASAKTSPMFRSVRPSQQWEASEPRRSINPVVAFKTEQAVALLPTPHAMAIRWCYVWRWPPGRAARTWFGGDLLALGEAVDAGRERLLVVLEG